MSLDDGYVTAEYLKKVADRARSLKRLSHDHMALTSGMTVLDAGCGPGTDTVPLGTRVGARGRVIGLDRDRSMLEEARKAAREATGHGVINYVHGSVLDIPLADGSVDASRAERLLQVMSPDFERTAVGELVRVTRPEGRVVLVDTDWSSAGVDFPDASLERRLMTFFALQMRPNGLAGRRLYALCREHLLEDIGLDIVPTVQHHFDDTPFGDWLVTAATAEGVITPAEARQWEQELRDRDRKERFHACVNMVVASGRKPASRRGC